ncbi:transposable element Tc3 transposase [Trichonephila clavipes]|nr:transposable element Tc3 transposase [Trichonephila clavipes]
MAPKTKEISLDMRKHITELHNEEKSFREIGTFNGECRHTPNTSVKDRILYYILYIRTYTGLRPLKTKRAEEEYPVLSIFFTFGVPAILQSGNGREFSYRILSEICANKSQILKLKNISMKLPIPLETEDQFEETEKLTVWSALWAGGIIGPYFFKNDEGRNVTVNGDRYRAMITNFFIPELNNHDIQELWFQQDGATCHTARATIDLLKGTFGDRLISRFGPVNWPPRSCDLTPLDYFLWGYVKSLVYVDKPQTLDHLEDNIRRVIADIRPQMLEKVIGNWTSRLDYIRASRGSHTPKIIFKM